MGPDGDGCADLAPGAQQGGQTLEAGAWTTLHSYPHIQGGRAQLAVVDMVEGTASLEKDREERKTGAGARAGAGTGYPVRAAIVVAVALTAVAVSASTCESAGGMIIRAKFGS